MSLKVVYASRMVVISMILTGFCLSCSAPDTRNTFTSLIPESKRANLKQVEVMLSNGEKMFINKYGIVRNNEFAVEFMDVRDLSFSNELSTPIYAVVTQYSGELLKKTYILINKKSGKFIFDRLEPVISTDGKIAVVSGEITEGLSIEVYGITIDDFVLLKKNIYGFNFEVSRMRWNGNAEVVYYYKSGQKSGVGSIYVKK